MELGELLRQLVFDYTLRTIVLGCALLGIANGALGAFALLRRQSLIGDSLSHAALPGVCIAFLLAGETKNPLILLIGAAISGWLGSVLAAVITQNTRIKDDAAQGIVLATFFGTGYVLLSLIQSSAGAGQAGLDKYLFGSAASLIERDVQTIAVLSIVALSVLGWFYKEFKLLAFDGEFLASLGFPRRRLELLLTSLTVIVVVVGLRIVGVPTSEESAAQARALGIPLVEITEDLELDLTVDGADEVAPNLDLVKGWGGALVRERIVAAASQRQVILVGPEKLVPSLGARGRIPVEVIPLARGFVTRRLVALGALPTVRLGADGKTPFITCLLYTSDAADE